jgi:hypothetical protein
MKNNKIAVWGFVAVAVLYVLAGLRDLFAPGFFTISPQLPGKGQIITQFGMAVMCLALAAAFRVRDPHRANKK